MILHIKQQVNDQVNKAVTAEKEKLREKLAMVEELTKELQSEKSQTRNLTELLNEKEALINKYKQHLRQLAQENPDNYELAEKIQDIENFREDRIINIKQLQKLVNSLKNSMTMILHLKFNSGCTKPNPMQPNGGHSSGKPIAEKFSPGPRELWFQLGGDQVG